jgi:hypothetical protein
MPRGIPRDMTDAERYRADIEYMKAYNKASQKALKMLKKLYPEQYKDLLEHYRQNPEDKP